MKSLRSIAPLRAGIVLGISYGLLSLLLVPVFLILVAASKMTGSPMNGMTALPLAMIVILPVAYAALGFLGGIIGAVVYNLIAKLTGGLKFELVDA